MTTAEDAIRAAVPPGVAEDFLARGEPSVRLTADAGATDAVLGGPAPLPPGATWPAHAGVPMDFLAAVDLAAVHRELPDAPLPPDGTLLFFAFADLGLPGQRRVLGAIHPDTSVGWHVRHVPSSTDTVLTPPPVPDATAATGRGLFGRRRKPRSPQRWRATPMRAVGEQTWPNIASDEVDLDLADEHLEAIDEAVLQLMDPLGPRHRVGGWADPTQSVPALPAALADAGLVDAKGQVQWARHAEVDHSPEAWFLLLQLDTDDGPGGPGWMWGDAGVMFFHGRPDDLRAGRWDRVWLNWDCY